MLSSVIGDFVTWAFRMTVKAVAFLAAAAVFVVGAGLLTGMLSPNDLKPANISKTILSCQSRLNSMKGLAGDLSDVNYSGVVQNMREHQLALEQLSAVADGYDDLPLERVQRLSASARRNVSHSAASHSVTKAGLF